MSTQRLEVFAIEIFEGKTMSDLIRESYDSINQEHATTDKYLRDIIAKAKNASDVMMIQETLSNLINNMGKRPENLIKLLATVQRITSTKIIGKSEDSLVSEEYRITEEDRRTLFSLANEIVKIEGAEKKNESDKQEPTSEEPKQLPAATNEPAQLPAPSGSVSGKEG